MRRCDNIAKASSSRNAASTLTSWPEKGASMSALNEEVRQHPQHREEERGGEELGREEQAQLREDGFGQREARPGERELKRERGERDRQRRPVAGRRDAPGREERDTDRHVGEELYRHRPLYQREVPRRVLEDHRLVHHGELEVRGRVV